MVPVLSWYITVDVWAGIMTEWLTVPVVAKPSQVRTDTTRVPVIERETSEAEYTVNTESSSYTINETGAKNWLAK